MCYDAIGLNEINLLTISSVLIASNSGVLCKTLYDIELLRKWTRSIRRVHWCPYTICIDHLKLFISKTQTIYLDRILTTSGRIKLVYNIKRARLETDLQLPANIFRI